MTSTEGTTEATELEEDSDEEIPPLALDVRNWPDHKQVGPVVLRVEVRNKC